MINILVLGCCMHRNACFVMFIKEGGSSDCYSFAVLYSTLLHSTHTMFVFVGLIDWFFISFIVYYNDILFFCPLSCSKFFCSVDSYRIATRHDDPERSKIICVWRVRSVQLRDCFIQEREPANVFVNFAIGVVIGVIIVSREYWQYFDIRSKNASELHQGGHNYGQCQRSRSR